MNRIFRDFCINRFSLGPLHYISSRSDFGFEFAEIFVFEKRLPVSSRGYVESATLRLNDTGSRRLTVSLVRGVDDSPYHWYREFSFKKFNSRLPVSVIAGSRFSNTNISANSKPWGTHEEPISAKTPENPPHCHVPLSSLGIEEPRAICWVARKNWDLKIKFFFYLAFFRLPLPPG